MRLRRACVAGRHWGGQYHWIHLGSSSYCWGNSWLISTYSSLILLSLIRVISDINAEDDATHSGVAFSGAKER